MQLSRLVVLTSAFVLATALVADADDVSGKVSLRGGGLTIDAAQTPAYWSVWNGALPFNPMKKSYEDHLVVVLTGGKGKAEGCRFDLRNASVSPSTIVTSAGKAVSLTNRDGFAYELYSEGGEQLPKTLVVPAGKITLPTLASAGQKLVLRDSFHPHVKGTVVAVSQLAACADVDASGDYEFKDVPKGSYTLKAFWDGMEIASKKIDMDRDDVDVKTIKGNIARVSEGALQ